MKKGPQHEPAKRSLEVLLHYLRKHQYQDLENYLRWDFCWKLDRIASTTLKHKFLRRYVAIREPDVAESMEDKNMGDKEEKREVDVVIVNVIQNELVATQVVFGISPSSLESYNARGMRFWNTQVPTATGNEPLDVAVTMIGAARNQEAAAAMSTIFATHKVGLAVLVGISAGLKSKTQIGDVVIAHDSVIDYEGQRLEVDGPKKRPVSYTVPLELLRDISHFDAQIADWPKRRLAAIRHMRDIRSLSELCDSWDPKVHLGVVMTGEKLIADSSLPLLQSEYHDKVRAGEMEGSGFARMCVEAKVPWAVFRGISDYGDPDKADWPQIPASLSAASCLDSFLRTAYRPPAVVESENF
jgi:nucleoside phosphorylase